jgi:uncharacterized protein YsxB (DUF464 family)
MIKVKIGKDIAGNLKRFVVMGHAGYAKTGRDIVCSAVSTVAFTAAGALGDLIGIQDFFSERDGFMSCNIDMELSVELRHDANIIMKTAEIGFKQIALAYPRYVKVMDEEV